MAKLFNRAKMTTSTTGSGTVTLGSASVGYQSFADAGVSNGDVVQYVIEEGSNFEIGTGTYSSTGTSLTRSPTESSNSNAAISLTGAATVSITAVADDLNRLQNAGSDIVTVSASGAAVTGNITVTGTVDGRDLSVDGAKLDGIEAGADVTDTTNVTAAGALMDSEVTNLAQVKAFDSSDYATAAQGTTADAALPKAGGTMTGALNFGDSVKAQFGASNDLQIYHTGAYSTIKDVGTGDFFIGGDGFVDIGNAALSLTRARFSDSSSALYQQGDIKLATTSTGISVTGNATFADNGKAIFGVGSDLQIYHDGSNSYIAEVGAGNLRVQGTNNVYLQVSSDGGTTWENAVLCDADGPVTLRYNNANKLATTGTGVDVTGYLTADGLNVENTSGYGNVEIGGSSGGLVDFKAPFSDDFDSRIIANGTDFTLDNQNAGSIIINNNLAERMRITSTGSVGIGTSSPTTKLSVLSSTNAGISVNDGTVNTILYNTSSANGTIGTTTNHPMAVYTNNAERLRVDTSGNLLLGKTALDFNAVGVAAQPAGVFAATRDGGTPVIVNRKTSDGELIQLQKDGTSVGSIGVAASDDFYIGGTTANHAGVYFGENIVYPMRAGSLSDGVTNLGNSSNRFKDAYFSGTVNATSFSGDGSSLTGIAAGATGGGSDEIFWENGQTVTSNYTITNGKNAMSAGPITINTGVTVTVGSGETWTVV